MVGRLNTAQSVSALRCRTGVVAACAAMAAAAVLSLTGLAAADPAGNDAPPPLLPVVTPIPTNWQPRFPFPYDQTRDKVTAADITAAGEMCQWYNAQYDQLIHQVETFNLNLIGENGNWNAPGINEQADAVVANLNESLDFLTPRAQALTITQDSSNDQYFPLFQGESFYRLWQQLSNVRDGLRGRQPAWFTGPSFQHAQRFGSKIHRSHVCD